MSYPIPKTLALEPKENGMCVYVSSVYMSLQISKHGPYSVDKMLSTFVSVAYAATHSPANASTTEAR